MPFPNVGHLAQGEEWTHPLTGQRYKVGLNGVMQKFSKVADLDEIFVDQNEFDESQGIQNNQINAIETQLQLLAQVAAAGKWTYKTNIAGGSPRPPAAATFYGTHKDGADVRLMNWADVRLIMINKTDLGGNVFNFSNFVEGDKLEILAVDGSSACYGTVTNDPSQEAYGNMVIAVERSNGGPPQNSEKDFLVSVYRPGASPGADIDALDNRYVIKTGDAMTGALTFNRDNKPNNQFKIAPNGGTDYATNIYALNNGQIRLRTSHTATEKDNVGSHIILDPNNGTPQTKIYNIVSPTSNLMAANKAYVDNNVANRTWKYKSGGGNPGPGEFTVSGENYIRLHHTTFKGMDLNFSSGFNEDLNNGATNFAKLAFTAWKISQGKAQGKFFIWVGWFNDTSGYFELKDLSSTDKTDVGLEGTAEYELHLAGFF